MLGVDDYNAKASTVRVISDTHWVVQVHHGGSVDGCESVVEEEGGETFVETTVISIGPKPG